MRIVFAGLLILVVAATVVAEARSRKQPDEATLEAGLREALALSAERSIATLSAEDGIWGDPLYRLPIPEAMSGGLVTALTAKGMSAELETFEASLNRAAERLVGGSGESVTHALDKLEIEDAAAILEGGDTAATLYFNAAAYDSIKTAMIRRARTEVERGGIYQQMATLLTRYTKVASVSRPQVDINTYIVDGAMQALFGQMAQEERRIREERDARPTKTLRRVFAGG